MLEKLKEHLNNMTPEEKEEARKFLAGPVIPKGWVSIEDHLPMMMASDLMSGMGTRYTVADSEGNESRSYVMDHNVWYYMAKEKGITHWLNE